MKVIIIWLLVMIVIFSLCGICYACVRIGGVRDEEVMRKMQVKDGNKKLNSEMGKKLAKMRGTPMPIHGPGLTYAFSGCVFCLEGKPIYPIEVWDHLQDDYMVVKDGVAVIQTTVAAAEENVSAKVAYRFRFCPNCGRKLD